MMLLREAALHTRKRADSEKWSEKTKTLANLEIGDHVSIQNCHGNSPLKWDKRGVIVSYDGFDKYGVNVDGSRRLTFRNRKHLKKFVPLYSDPLIDDFSNENELQGEKLTTPEHVQRSVPLSPNPEPIENELQETVTSPLPSHAKKQMQKKIGNPDPVEHRVLSKKPNIVVEPMQNVNKDNVTSMSPMSDPIVNPEPKNNEVADKICTPATPLRRSSRSNKGINSRLENVYEMYNLCCHCINNVMCHRSFRDTFPTSCDGGGGGIADVDTSLQDNDCQRPICNDDTDIIAAS